MSDMEDKLLSVMERVAGRALIEFQSRGGVVTNGPVSMAAEDFSSFRGALSPILWMSTAFFRDWGLSFPKVIFREEVESMTGFVVDHLEVTGSESPALFSFSDFVRNELLGEHSKTLDLSTLLTNFRAWGLENIAAPARVAGPGITPADE